MKFYKPINTIETFLNQNIYLRWLSLFNHNISLRHIEHIDLEPIAACNLQCSFCQVPGWHRARETRAMSIDLFNKILLQFPNLKRIKLQGMGEPFLNKNLIEMIRIASNSNIKTTVITNGTLLTDSLNNKVLESNLSQLNISFDGATKHTYESMRKGADYNKVLHNIQTFCKLRNKNKYPTAINIICLVSSRAILDELPSLVKLASELGVDEVRIKKRLKIWEKKEKAFYPAESLYVEDFGHYSKMKEEALAMAHTYGIKFSMVGDPEYSLLNPCDWPWKSLYVSVEGKIVPCCVIGSPDTWCMGDLNKEDLHRIWNNKLFKGLRKKTSLNLIPELCKSCYK